MLCKITAALRNLSLCKKHHRQFWHTGVVPRVHGLLASDAADGSKQSCSRFVTSPAVPQSDFDAVFCLLEHATLVCDGFARRKMGALGEALNRARGAVPHRRGALQDHSEYPRSNSLNSCGLQQAVLPIPPAYHFGR